MCSDFLQKPLSSPPEDPENWFGFPPCSSSSWRNVCNKHVLKTKQNTYKLEPYIKPILSLVIQEPTIKFQQVSKFKLYFGHILDKCAFMTFTEPIFIWRYIHDDDYYWY